MNDKDTPRTKAGLTLREAELRIEALESAAAKAIRVLTEMLMHEDLVDKHGEALLACVDVLFVELKLEGVIHSEYVVNSLERTRRAVDQMRLTLSEQRRANRSRKPGYTNAD
jgi:hypothetical protein